MFRNSDESSKVRQRKRSRAADYHRMALTITVGSISLIGLVHPLLPRTPIWPASPIAWPQFALTPLAIVATAGFIYALVSSLRQ